MHARVRAKTAINARPDCHSTRKPSDCSDTRTGISHEMFIGIYFSVPQVFLDITNLNSLCRENEKLFHFFHIEISSRVVV